MAVSYTSDTDKTPTTGSSFTYTSFAVSGTNPVIIVLIGLADDTATVSSVAVSAGLTSGTPVEVVTKRAALGDPPATYLSAWALPAPSGTGTITVTLSASVAWQSTALLLAGADQTTPCPTGSSNATGVTGSTPNPLSITLTNLASGEIGIGFGAQSQTGDAPSFDHDDVNTFQTFINNTTNINASGGYRIGAGAMTVTWGTASANDTMIALRVVAASGGATVHTPHYYQMIGTSGASL